MSELKGVLFDCDGVLVDSREANIATYQNLLEAAGYPRPTVEQVSPLFHLPLRETIIALTGITDEQEIDRILEFVKDKSVRATHLFKFPDSLEDVLKELHTNYKQGVVTSRIGIGLDDVLEASNIGKYFDTFVVREDYARSKPYPDSLIVAAGRLMLAPSEAVYIGDSHVDVEAARDAGMMSIHLANEIHNDANIGITNFAEIPKAIEKLSN